MRALLRIAALWRGQAPAMALGLQISLLALATGLALMGASGAAVSTAALGAVVAPVALLRALGPARVALRYAERLSTHGATFRALAWLRVWFFRRLAANSAGGLGMRDGGDLLARLVGDIDRLDGMYLRLALPFCAALLCVPAVVLLALRLDAPTALAVAALLSLAVMGVPAAGYAMARRFGAEEAEARAGLQVAALDAMTGLREIAAYGAEPRVAARIAAAGAGVISAERRLARRGGLLMAATLLCLQGAMLALMAASDVPAAARVTAIFVLAGSFEVLAAMPRTGIAAAQAASAAARVLEAADAQAAYPEPPAPAAGQNLTMALGQHPSLSFEAVHFAWAADRPNVLRGLTLEIPAGARVAILGPSGSGKSTLAALALRVVAPQAGRVLIGGIDLADLPAAALRRQIAWLGQHSHIFADSIRNNLTLARPDASEADLWQALTRARIDEVVRALPEGLDTWLGEGGAALSGGQARRVALARALLAQAPILLLDEPCAGLDAQTEREFLATLFAETRGQTVMLITHRLTGAEKLDRIYRLSEGRAVAALA